MDKVLFPFVLYDANFSNSDPYFQPSLESLEDTALESDSISPSKTQSCVMGTDTSGFIFYLNCFTSVRRLCILFFVALKLLAIAHRKEHPGFSHCYEIISWTWFIWGLTKFLQFFIHHCPQYLAFQIKRYKPYSLLQPIQSSPVPFFMLMLDFILALPVSKEDYNTLMLVTCKFSKRVTLIKSKNIFTADEWTHAFFARLDFIN